MGTSNESNRNALEQYNEWLKQFFRCYEKFEEYVVDKRGKRDNTLSVRINTFNNLENPCHNKDAGIYGIGLDMADNHNSFLEGPTIVLDKNQRDIYKYLLINIFYYYINKNYNGKIPNDYAGLLFEDLDIKQRSKEKTRPSDSFAVMVLGLPEQERVGFYRSYFDASIFYNEFQTELDTLVRRHNYDISSIDDILCELIEQILSSDKPISPNESQLEKSKVRAGKVMELVMNSRICNY